MSQITKPMLLDETGKQIVQALNNIAAKCGGEGGSGGKGMLYIYKALKDEILDWGDENYFYIEVNGEHIELDAAFFNSCLYLDFGGTSAEAGVYVYPYEGTLKLYIYESVEASVNGDYDSWGDKAVYTFTAPQDAHVTLA